MDATATNHDRPFRTWTANERDGWAVSQGRFFPSHGRSVAFFARGSTIRTWRVGMATAIHLIPGRITSFDISTLLVVILIGGCSSSKSGSCWGNRHESLLWKRVQSYSHDRGEVVALEFSPDGKYLASGSHRTVKILNANDGFKEIRSYSHEDKIWTLGFSPDARYLASGGWDKKIQIHSLLEGIQKVKEIPVEMNVWALAFSPDSHYLAAGLAQGVVQIFSVTKDFNKITDVALDWTVGSLCFSPGGEYLACGSRGGGVRVISVADGFDPAVSYSLGRPVKALTFSSNGRYLIVAGGT